MSESKFLEELASRHDILLSYEDMKGRRQRATTESLRGVLRGLGVAAATERECRESLRESELRKWRQALEPVILDWDRKGAWVRVRLPDETAARGTTLQLLLEDGSRRQVRLRSNGLRVVGRAEIDGRGFIEGLARLPGLPFGFHELSLEIHSRIHRSRLISAPSCTYSPPEQEKAWGIFLPMYALHSASSWGAGNLGDYERLCSWTRSLGGTVIAPLPLLAGFLDSPTCEPSPYSPASRLFWNEFYIDVTGAPEFASCRAAQRLARSPAFRASVERFRKAPVIDYRAEMAARRSVLEIMAAHFFRSNSNRRRDYDGFLKDNPAAVDYAEFRATLDRRRVGWRQWEQRMRYGKLQREDYSEPHKAYHLFCQWLVEDQMSGLLDRFRQHGGRFHLDLPLGVHPDGYDVWRWPDAFASGMTVGAPPDMFFTRGQNWGFAPLHPHRLRERGYDYVLKFLRFQMRHTGLLRLDHVMGLHRLYWIPSGLPANQGTYVRYHAEELFAILCLESHRNRTVIIGENLGTVPPEVTRAMRQHDLRETYVAQYSQSADPHRPLIAPPKRSIGMINTHDMPTFEAHWRGTDIKDRSRLGLISRKEAGQAKADRMAKHDALAKFLQRRGLLKLESLESPAILRALLEWLATSQAETLLINLEDLWGESRPQNMPGLVNRLNWRRKARLPLEDIEASPALRSLLSGIDRLRREASRKGKPLGSVLPREPRT